jgi:hypothetical protein
MKITYRKFQVITISILLLILALSKGSDRFVQFLIKPEIQAIEKQYGIDIQYKTVALKSLSKALIKEATATSGDSGLILTAHSILLRIDARKLLARKIDIQQLEADKVIVNLKTVYQNEEKQLTIDIPSLKVKDHAFSMEIRSEEHGVENEWVCSGTLPDKQQKINLRLYTKDTEKKIVLPFTEEIGGGVVKFDTLALELSRKTKQAGILTVQGKAGIKGLHLYHELLSPDTIVLDRGFIQFANAAIGKNFFETDGSQTSVYLNKLKLNPSIKIEKKEDWHIRAALDKKDFPAEDFFSSIPKGMFHHIEGLEAEGVMTYHFLLDADLANVKNLRFESTLQAKDFRILQYGNTDLRKMNDPFSLVIYENNLPVRTLRLGYENPDFCPYGSISRFLPYAIMHAEDAGFMHHAGFIPEAFERSLAQDITERRFARGGSTLSMQLVKNVFLNHDKTISRKLEEIMIVWLIETCRLTSKQRMFEVYMNIIEWGDDIYGVMEASRYYFAKEPSALNLGECIFLSYIISAPKQAQNHFNGTRIKPAFHAFYRDAVKRLLQRGWITPGEAAAGNPNITIRGPFRERLIK